MSRSGYSDNCDGWQLILWRGAVTKAIKGKRGQAFLNEMLAAMDAMPEKRLITDELITPSGEVCAIGSVMAKRGISAKGIDPDDSDAVARTVGVAAALVKEIEYVNDEAWCYGTDITPEKRFEKVRAWIVSQIQVQQ